MTGIELRRKLSCPKCHKYEWHLSTIAVDREVNICQSCEWIWDVTYSDPSKLYSQLVHASLERIRDSVASGLARTINHGWSKNLGTRDREQLERIQMDLEYALKLIDTFTGN